MWNNQVLELAITDFCNLQCPLCCQATPIQKNKKIMPMEQLERISRLIEPHEFHAIKISGGEPTLHPRFGEICDRLPELFPGRLYILASNGKLMEKHKDHLDVFDRIDLSEYPGLNKEFHSLVKLGLVNLSASTKNDYVEMEDVNSENNQGKTGIHASCHQANVKKIVQDRIYACCVIFGNSIRQKIDLDAISVPMDEHWRENLAHIELEPHCRRCWVDVPIGRAARVGQLLRRAYGRRHLVVREIQQGRWRALRTRVRVAVRGRARPSQPSGGPARWPDRARRPNA